MLNGAEHISLRKDSNQLITAVRNLLDSIIGTFRDHGERVYDSRSALGRSDTHLAMLSKYGVPRSRKCERRRGHFEPSSIRMYRRSVSPCTFPPAFGTPTLESTEDRNPPKATDLNLQRRMHHTSHRILGRSLVSRSSIADFGCR